MIPTVIQEVMAAGAAMAISISGGKDSQAQLNYVVRCYREYGWTGKLFALFCDLGEIEWQGTLEHCYSICQAAGIELVVVQRSPEGMIGRWQERREKLQSENRNVPFWSSAQNRYCTDHLKTQMSDKFFRSILPIDELLKEGEKPFWSSSAARYCTKELKEQECDKELRSIDSEVIVCCVGIRAQESKSRATKPVYSVRSSITTASCKTPPDSKTAELQQAWAERAWQVFQNLPSRKKNGQPLKKRFALTWHPIFDWSVDQVWQACGTSLQELEWRRMMFQCGLFHEAFNGWKGHWAYVTGNSRLSCSQCVLASRADLENGAKLNQSTWRKLVQMEQESGWSFKNDMALSDLAPLIEKTPPEWVDRIYSTLREMELIYLDEHWRLNGQQLTELVSEQLSPQQLAQKFMRMVA